MQSSFMEQLMITVLMKVFFNFRAAIRFQQFQIYAYVSYVGKRAKKNKGSLVDSYCLNAKVAILGQQIICCFSGVELVMHLVLQE